MKAYMSFRTASRGTAACFPARRTWLPVLLGMLLVGACSRLESSPPLTGGGTHEIHGIHLRPQGHGLGKASGTVKLAVGDELKLQVTASWGIPSVTDVTRVAIFEVEPTAAGIVLRGGVFQAQSPGLAHIRAILVADQEGGSNSAILTDTLAVNIVAKEPPDARP